MSVTVDVDLHCDDCDDGLDDGDSVYCHTCYFNAESSRTELVNWLNTLAFDLNHGMNTDKLAQRIQDKIEDLK